MAAQMNDLAAVGLSYLYMRLDVEGAAGARNFFFKPAPHATAPSTMAQYMRYKCNVTVTVLSMQGS